MPQRRLMRAARFYGPDRPIQIEETPYPEPGPDDVVVRVAACGICGSDIHFLEGMPIPAGLPITLGHEPAGIVESVGASVTEWAPGDRVALHLGNGCGTCRTCQSGHPNCCSKLIAPGLHIDGAFAEAVRVPAGSLVRVPDAVSLTAAAVATDCVGTPYHALTCRAKLQRGERVAVIGVGGVGGQAVRLASVLGAGQVVAVDLSAVALDRAARSGATDTIRVNAGEDPAMRIRDVTDGGADLVLECVGSAATVASGVRALLPGGRLIAVGVGMMPPHIDLPQAIFCLTELAVIGSFGSHKEDLEEIFRLEAAGAIDIEATISHRLPLSAVADGLEMLRTKRDHPQRIVVEIPTR
jgi:2-desacetyl-2-hydroxyethyl bacteriochlorophyllide A dehydrogenase